jgi:hypothetical protein
MTASRALGVTAASRVLGDSKRSENVHRRPSVRTLAGSRVGGRGRRAWPFPPIGRCCWRGIVHTKLRRPCAALPARVSGARQSSKLYARTCAEGDDASKPRADVQSDGNPFFARPNFASGIPV